MAFTPGLTVSECVTIRKTRRLPIRGKVLVGEGTQVEAGTIVAQAELPGPLAVIKAAGILGCSPERLNLYTRVAAGVRVKKGEVVASRSVLFGLSTTGVRSPIDGTVEYVSQLSGNIAVRGAPTLVTCRAYVAGVVVEVLPEEGVVIETQGAFVQGIFGVGGERHGRLVWCDNGGMVLGGEDIGEDHRGCVVMHSGRIARDALAASVRHGVVGIVGASIIDEDLMSFLGYDIGVAITGEEAIPFTVIVTEGFGQLEMPAKTRGLLARLAGAEASLNGATQIRAGVIRPELIVPRRGGEGAAMARPRHELRIGTQVRLIRRPRFGAVGVVVGLPEQPVQIETGSHVRVALVRLVDGTEVRVPRANLEIMAE
ncbi:MAG: hypothetical protein N2595_06780 [bacterium]|nr:hypothetical protein [bacterium]